MIAICASAECEISGFSGKNKVLSLPKLFGRPVPRQPPKFGEGPWVLLNPLHAHRKYNFLCTSHRVYYSVLILTEIPVGIRPVRTRKCNFLRTLYRVCYSISILTDGCKFLQNFRKNPEFPYIFTDGWKFIQNAVHFYKCSDSHSISLAASNSYRRQPLQPAAIPTELTLPALSYRKIDPVSNFLLWIPSLKCYELMDFCKTFLKSRPPSSNLNSRIQTSCIKSSILHPLSIGHNSSNPGNLYIVFATWNWLKQSATNRPHECNSKLMG